MQTLLLLAVLSQVATTPSVTLPVERPPFTFSDGQRTYKLWDSATLIAEPSPTPALRAAILAAEPKAEVVVDLPTMRVWKVRDAVALRTKLKDLRPVFHDTRAGTGRFRVPLALVCGDQRVIKPWAEVLSGSGGACLPDFWYPPVLR